MVIVVEDVILDSQPTLVGMVKRMISHGDYLVIITAL